MGQSSPTQPLFFLTPPEFFPQKKASFTGLFTFIPIRIVDAVFSKFDHKNYLVKIYAPV